GGLRNGRRLGRAARIVVVGRRHLVVLLIPVLCPLPDIADHVEQAVASWWKGPYWSGAFVAVEAQVLDWKLALPGVGHLLPLGANSLPQAYSAPLRPPRAANSHSASLGRALPTHPAGVCQRIGECHVHDRMPVTAAYGAFWTLRMAPVGAGYPSPP